MSDARNPALTTVISKALEGLGLELTNSDQETAISNPELRENGRFVVDHSYRYLAWERQEYDYWYFDDLPDNQAAVFIAGKIRQLVEEARLADEFNALVERARREDLSARVLSGELDDVNLNVRRTKPSGERGSRCCEAPGCRSGSARPRDR
jgi:hypothetical protein